MLDDHSQKLRLVYSHTLDVPIQIKIGTLEGKFKRPDYDSFMKDNSLRFCVAANQDNSQQTGCSSLLVTVEIYCDSKRACPRTATAFKTFTTRYNWNEWLTLPICYSELTRDAVLAITIWDHHDSVVPHAVGGTSIALFSKRGIYRQGIFDLKIWPFVEGDGVGKPTSTPGKLTSKSSNSQMARLAKLVKKHHNGLIEKVDWLDRLTFREIELINDKEKRSANMLFLMIEFARVQHEGSDHFVVFYEHNGSKIINWNPSPSIVSLPDPEIGLDNLCEAKQHALARSVRSRLADRDLKPNAATRDQLMNIISYAPTIGMSTEEKDLVWKFRFYLRSNKKALAKFFKCVNWDVEHEAKQASDLLKQWEPMDVEDALELLSPAFSHAVVRKYAVYRLQSAHREELLLYLLQLVQALRYESRANQDENDFDLISSLNSAKLDESGASDSTLDVSASGEELLSEDGSEKSCKQGGSRIKLGEFDEDSQIDLASFLILKACQDDHFANYLYWYLMVESDQSLSAGSEDVLSGLAGGALADPRHQAGRTDVANMYRAVLRRLSKVLVRGGTANRRRRAVLVQQQAFVQRLVHIMEATASEGGSRKKKIEFLQTQLCASSSDPSDGSDSNIEVHSLGSGSINMSNLDGLPLPVDPSVRLKSVVAEKTSLFNSALMPCKLTFLSMENKEYVTIFKYGDDLRQDQLILQIVALMDRLLKEENLDLKLTSYKVLATSPNHGFVQHVESEALRDVLSDWDSNLQNYLRHHNPDPNGHYGIAPSVLDNYIRSLAGYSIVCYLLGVGDRHLHNLLLTKTGKLFHVDFGYILGRDPKPLPPPMKLTKEMIDGLGGHSSSHWQDFRNLCYTAFLILRRHANLIMNLFSLMVDASIPDIALEPDKTVRKVQDRFRLDLSDEEAVHFIQQMIDVSVSARIPQLVDFVHDVAQYLRN